ncbi:TIGR03767 family metallophosphoesterase [Nocardioides sp.]|uniref:TIGR03767 family metallophosphoesterase n=1 Tax=Nocardioides sp. TaxID=35761 RepID=UPI002D7FD767|nr:TIGR03767 family metallophosphoesterase [Nocardioides sp.]HET8962186.1 TIGR03767 family metallophosphoesterase [Nocardioides sp.]
MNLTRRDLFRAAGAVGGAAVLGGLAAEAVAGVPARGRTTLDVTLRRGPAGEGGYRPVVRADGEPHVVRTDLGAPARSGRRSRRKPLLAFAQLSDVHIVDAQSPMRVEYVDRYDDQDQPDDPTPGIFGAAYRPQEVLTAQIVEAMVREINQIGAGPVTGKPLAFAIQTGDNSDNSQYNEIRWNIDVLDGGEVRADSGDLSRYEGVMDGDPTYYDTHYWHPDGTPAGKEDDQPRSRYGFPEVPGLLDAARRPFRAAGLGMPWYTALGNHDPLAQGNFPSTMQLNTVAVGPLKMISPPTGVSQADVLNALRGNYADFVAAFAATPHVRQVTPDPDRRLLQRAEIVEEHFTTTGSPVGHGFTETNRADGTAYYAFDRGLLRFVVLDTVNPNGEANGSLDQAQFAWLQAQLQASAGRLVVVASHHTARTMDNPLVGTGGDPQPRVLGDEVVAELLAHHNVIAWVNGHTHSNNVWAHQRDGGGGFWEINTASHVDWPQQARLIEVTDNRDGTLSIFATMVDHGAPLSYGGRLDGPIPLAALARELAANDWQERDRNRRGARSDRNVELLVAAPAFLA